jgi:hypothetical protein
MRESTRSGAICCGLKNRFFRKNHRDESIHKVEKRESLEKSGLLRVLQVEQTLWRRQHIL